MMVITEVVGKEKRFDSGKGDDIVIFIVMGGGETRGTGGDVGEVD